MKKRHLFAISLIGLALAACSTDDELNAGGNQSNEGAVVTLKLDMAGSQTKGSPGATNAQPGTTVENTISNVTVVVDYGTTQKVFKSSDNYEGDYGWTDASKTFKFQTPAGDATFYVYANVKDADDLSEGWKNEKDKMVSAGEESSYYANSNFFMSNQNGVGIKHTINEDTENNITVNIERAAAKVTVQSAKKLPGTYGGALTAMSFALGNKTDKFYLLQQKDFAIPDVVQYIPNPDIATSWKSVTLGEEAEKSEGKITNLSDFIADYCMENVPTDDKQNKTTYIKFQTTFTPAKALKFDNSTQGNWTVNAVLQDVVAPENAADAPSFFVVLDGDANYTSNYILKSDLYDGENAKTGLTITAESDGSGLKITGINGITKISNEYIKGKCYFGPIWFNPQDGGAKSPVYRNDWYHLTVTDINLPGLSSEPGDGGEVPLIPDVNVSVTLKVLDWELEEREIVLQ